MSEVLSRAQPSIQLEEAMKASFKLSDGGGKLNSTYETPDTLMIGTGGSLLIRSRHFLSAHQRQSKLQIDGMLHSLEAPDQRFRRSKLIKHNLSLLRS